ncbi:orotidine-5'-phosphate decarboxylase [Brevibacillus sp. SYP-B805]|uniref:orotidine-5'-phosphate decarboxylase n=1 Tax=Brevibacillus sp. SYP-B805 TaxID=1578199 RepID=UPI0013ED4A5C|nr:orotidine-5'-phosphate decarboxylase [Brevibacillus sp. SYP-B805]NGQ93771.1 orotidine-5'-phosphate decarboxylase [Brevibacillus sp. SYP-B805]
MAARDTDLRDRVILALDVPTIGEAESCLNRLEGEVRYVKVGMELFYAAGPEVIHMLKERGLRVFVDLKVHDIPNTARGAMKSLARLGADMVNVHAAGGKAMMAAAREGLEEGTPAGGTRPLLIGVTMLTSTSQAVMNQEIGIPGLVEETVVRYASLARDAGLDGVVASPLEVPLIKKAAGETFLTVTPGIRPAGADKGDQTRVTTPAEAFRLGSDYLVIGRAVTAADDPLAVWQSVIHASYGSTGRNRG